MVVMIMMMPDRDVSRQGHMDHDEIHRKDYQITSRHVLRMVMQMTTTMMMMMVMVTTTMMMMLMMIMMIMLMMTMMMMMMMTTTMMMMTTTTTMMMMMMTTTTTMMMMMTTTMTMMMIMMICRMSARIGVNCSVSMLEERSTTCSGDNLIKFMMMMIKLYMTKMRMMIFANMDCGKAKSTAHWSGSL